MRCRYEESSPPGAGHNSTKVTLVGGFRFSFPCGCVNVLAECHVRNGWKQDSRSYSGGCAIFEYTVAVDLLVALFLDGHLECCPPVEGQVAEGAGFSFVSDWRSTRRNRYRLAGC